MTYGSDYALTVTALQRAEPFKASASNVTTFQDCQRKWAWVVLDGRPRVSTEAAELGTRVHKVLEDYMSRGVPLNLDTREGQIAMAGVHLLPPPGTMATERLFSVRIGPDGSNDPRGILFVGRMDLSNLPRQSPRVVDHKTTSDFKWAKTPEGLQEDIQASLYAAVVLDPLLWDADRAVDLRWVYYRTQKPHRGMPIDTVLYPEARKKTLAKAYAVAHEMLRVYNDPSFKGALDLPPNWNACGKYAGCPYRGDCAASDPQNERLFKTLFPEEIGALQMSADPLAALAALAAQGHTPVAINPPVSHGLPQLPPQPPPALPQLPPQPPPQMVAPPETLPPIPNTPPRHPMAGKVSDDGRFVLSYDGQWVPCEPQKGPTPAEQARMSVAETRESLTGAVYRTETPAQSAPTKRGPGRPRKAVSENGDGPNDPSDAEIAAAVRTIARLFGCDP